MTFTARSTLAAFDLRQALQVSVLDALLSARRWEPHSLVFQGGTSLHLVHGSPRYSEDLDFLVRASLDLRNLGSALRARLEHLDWLPDGVTLSVGREKDARNPHSFIVAATGQRASGAVRVKVELWRTEQAALSSIAATVMPVRIARGPVSGLQTYVPVANLEEIYADKVFALAVRPYLKPRDVFDLHWLISHHGLTGAEDDERMRVRLATYPSVAPERWLAQAHERRAALRAAGAAIAADLRRWLPASWPLDEATVQPMIGAAIAALDRGIAAMQRIAGSDDVKREAPRP